MFHIEFVGMLREGSPRECSRPDDDRIADLPACGDHAKVALRECHYSAGP